MLKQTPVDDAVDDLKNQNMIGIVPSSTAEDIFEVDEFIKKYDNLYGYVGVFPEEVKGFTDKTLSDMENIIKNNPKFLICEILFVKILIYSFGISKLKCIYIFKLFIWEIIFGPSLERISNPFNISIFFLF
jgi:hypothetical protein